MSPDRFNSGPFSVDALVAHEGLVRGLARSILRGDDRVEDVVQETWATALTHSPREPGALGRWLGTISRRLALRTRRGDEARRRRESAPRGRAAVPTPAEITEREETRRAVLSALLDLDPLYRDALLLRFYEDLPPREVAAALDVPVETARTRIKRGIASLRRTLQSRYGDEKRALPLALVFLAESPKPAAAATSFAGLTAAAALITVIGAGFGILALVRPDRAPAPPPPPPAAHHPEAIPHTAPSPEVDEPAPVPPASRVGPPRAASRFAGMASIPAGPFRMGIDERALVRLYGDPSRRPTRKHHKLLTEKDKLEWWNFLLYETPEHAATTEAYAIDLHPITNAQYLRFLEDSARFRVRTGTSRSTLEEIAIWVHGDLLDDPWPAESLFWINEETLLSHWEVIQQTNALVIEASLKEFNEFRPEPARITDFRRLPDKQRAEAWVKFLLPEKLRLTAYTRPIPDHWLRPPVPPGERKATDRFVPRKMITKEMERRPVVWVTAEDADAFAEWAGKHLPTEAEWEKAGRGPKGWLYPWGPTWDWRKQPNMLVWRGATPWPKGPAARFLNHPVDVARCAASASPHGLLHMLGNVREWTSTVPTLYPDSKASEEPFLYQSGFRVLRSTSYGDGQTSTGQGKPNLELMHRLTTRALEFGVTERFQAVGFRCAKYPQPARDTLSGRLARLLEEGALPARLGLDLPRTMGLERLEDVPEATDTVFVRGGTRAIGFVPTKKVVARGDVEILGWLWWNADMKLSLRGGRKVGPGETGYLVGLREGVLGLYEHAARGPKVVGLPSSEDVSLRRREPADLPAGVFWSDSTLTLRVDVPIGVDTFRLVLPLTFEGRGRPDDTWRR